MPAPMIPPGTGPAPVRDSSRIPDSFSLDLGPLAVRVTCWEPYPRTACRDYLTDAPAQLEVRVTREELEAQQVQTPDCDPGYLEFLCLYRHIARALPAYRALVVHGACVTILGRAYLFTAPSGTGKSTHISLLHRYLGDIVRLVNGDKPILALEGDQVTAYGTPWAGKEGWQVRRSAPLAGICLLRRGRENTFTRLPPGACLRQMLAQVYVPEDPEGAGRTLELLDRILRTVPLCTLSCEPTEDAVRCSFEGLTGQCYEKWTHKGGTDR